MARTRKDLRDIGFRLDMMVRKTWPGLGLTGAIYDVNSRVATRPINIMLTGGMKEDEAVRMLRYCADELEKVSKGERGRLMEEESKIIVPGFIDMNKLKGN